MNESKWVLCIDDQGNIENYEEGRVFLTKMKFYKTDDQEVPFPHMNQHINYISVINNADEARIYWEKRFLPASIGEIL